MYHWDDYKTLTQYINSPRPGDANIYALVNQVIIDSNGLSPVRRQTITLP